MPTQKQYIIGNWKMHGDTRMAMDLASAVALHTVHGDTEIVLCPPAVLLAVVKNATHGSKLRLGAQDCSCHHEGAYTGEISAAMLKDAGCGYVIVGHSERRAGHGESSELVRKKAESVLDAGLTPVICIGETLADREAGRAEAVISEQLQSSLPGNQQPATILLAYEPVWAIGTGKTATAGDIQAMHAHIAAETGGKYPILYGGSVKAANAREILTIPGVSGVLVGGASLKADEFCAIAASAT